MKARSSCRWLLAGLLLSLAQAASGVELLHVRLWRAPDHTRIVFDLSLPMEGKAPRPQQLTGPERIYLDIPNATLNADFKADMKAIDLSNTPIETIRYGLHAGNVVRVTLVMTAMAKPNTFVLASDRQKSDRLVLDLYDVQQPPSVKKSVEDAAKCDVLVVIDAGHGGEDPGAIGPDGLREKDVVLAIARNLHRRFKPGTGFKALLVRRGDYYVNLEKRRDAVRAEREGGSSGEHAGGARDIDCARAHMFVSIHADAFKNAQARGASVYVISKKGAASSNYAKLLANRENAADLLGGVNPQNRSQKLNKVLGDMLSTGALDTSLNLGGRVLKEIGGFARLHRQRVERAGFMVLKALEVPSILVETGFISNAREARQLRSSRYQKKMAAAIYTGIHSWFVENPPENTLLAWQRRAGVREYVIRRGDTLSEIAQRFNVTVAALRRRNALSGNTILSGQKLIIPAS